MPPSGQNPELPSDLLHAAAERQGLVVLVVGAGCSLEAPTNLKLAREYALDVHRRLLLDGLLQEGQCEHPEDLSLLASVVWEHHGSQAGVVERLPRSAFRTARPNEGYLIAAALLREGAISSILTLNFDLAMSTALVDLNGADVRVIPGPAQLAQLGSSTVIYLHRNVDEPDLEKWILRREALEDEWRDSWEEVVARRVMAAPVTVFAGLGSPAAVLTETVSRIRAVVSDALTTYVVDPAQETPFQDALDLAPESHIRLTWVAFMRKLGARVAAEHSLSLEDACRTLCAEHGWTDEAEHAGSLCAKFTATGLVRIGMLRAGWLLDQEAFAPDDARRELVADLLLAIGLIERELAAAARFREDGVVEFERDGTVVASVVLASGGGSRRWAALEPRVRSIVDDLQPESRPAYAVLGGVQGARPEHIAPPEDLISGHVRENIINGPPSIEMVTIDELRDNADAIRRLGS